MIAINQGRILFFWNDCAATKGCALLLDSFTHNYTSEYHTRALHGFLYLTHGPAVPRDIGLVAALLRRAARRHFGRRLSSKHFWRPHHVRGGHVLPASWLAHGPQPSRTTPTCTPISNYCQIKQVHLFFYCSYTCSASFSNLSPSSVAPCGTNL